MISYYKEFYEQCKYYLCQVYNNQFSLHCVMFSSVEQKKYVAFLQVGVMNNNIITNLVVSLTARLRMKKYNRISRGSLQCKRQSKETMAKRADFSATVPNFHLSFRIFSKDIRETNLSHILYRRFKWHYILYDR